MTKDEKTISPNWEIAPREKRAFALVALLFVLAITLPYLWVWTTTPDGFVYRGLLYNPDDQNVHLAWARQAQEGAFFFRDSFTHESLGTSPLFTNLFAWCIGTLSRISTLPLIIWYHLARVVFAVLALWWLLRLVACWTGDARVRILTIALAGFSSGAGWLASVFPSRTFIDRAEGVAPTSPVLMMPEAWTFASAFIFPLYIVSVALIPLVLWQTTRAVRGGGAKHILCAALALAVLTNIHTYDAIPLGLVLLAWTVINLRSTVDFDRTLRFAPLLVSLGALPPLAYQLVVFRSSAEFQQKALTPTPAPAPLDLMLSFAPLLLLAAFGVWAARARKAETLLWPALLWLGAIVLCIYAPVSFARKMIEGVHLPLCFLAAVGLATLFKNLQSRALQVAGVVAVALLSISSWQFVAWCVGNAADNNQLRIGVFMPPLSLPADDMAALRELDESGEGRDGVVLSLPYLSNYVPRETGRTVFVGHWAETLNYWNPETRSGKLSEAQSFYGLGRKMSADDARAWLRENKIRFVVVGNYEREWMRQLRGALPLDLPVWKQNGATTIYKVPEK